MDIQSDERGGWNSEGIRDERCAGRRGLWRDGRRGRDTLARLLVSNCERRERERGRVTRKRARELAHLRTC